MADNPETIEKKANELRRLTLATRCFGGARAICLHMIELGLTERDSIYGPCITGMVVSYMRPFTGADGIGMISQNFASFPDPKLSAMHTELRLVRDTVYAHHVSHRAHELVIRDQSHKKPYETTVEFRVDTDGKIRIFPSVNIPEITVDSLLGFIELFEFQIERAFRAQTAVIRALASGKSYELGTYTLCVDFP